MKVVLLFLYFSSIIFFVESATDIKVFTVATEDNDGYKRYMFSAKHYNINVQTLGLGSNWHGGNMKSIGGGQKVNLFREALESYKDDDIIVIFTDSYDVVFTSSLEEILQKFKNFNTRILFGAENYCWPDQTLRNKYPAVASSEYRFINSGMFMGYANDIFAILQRSIEDNEDDQLYYTKIYLDKDLRLKHSIQLDHRSEIFQNLNGAENDVKLDINSDTKEGTLYNNNFKTKPSLIHGNGPSKIYLNSLANYLGGTFIQNKCMLCKQKLHLLKEDLPVVTIALFIEKPTPYFTYFLDKIVSINYPKELIYLFIHNNVKYHEEEVQAFLKNFSKIYKATKKVTAEDKYNERDARMLSIKYVQQVDSEYIFCVDADAHLDNKNILLELISLNKSFIAPLLSRPKELWSNFWGALSNAGFYARSHDYLDIVKKNVRGMWNVPYVSSCYLINKKVFKKIDFNHKVLDPDMALCEHMRNEGIFMFIVNEMEYGHLIHADNFIVDYIRPDFYTLTSNPYDWERIYIHPDYYLQLQSNFKHKQPCPDVYWFPIVTEKFCSDLIAIMEAFGKWSDGSNQDSRLEGGYEAVPTRDIHMNQVGLEAMWLFFLKEYVRPLQEIVFTGYYHNPPKSLMNFVVRYRPDEQPFLRPHHDSSTYTINIALNRVEVDYEGGGCHFLRYNCSVTDTQIGWMLMHPGRLTHFHEGLKVTRGTRYIMISFVDP